MAKPPKSPRAATPRKRVAGAPRRRSHGGRLVGAIAAVGGTAAYFTALANPSALSPAPVVCNGTERWPVKVATDADARAGKINLTPEGPYSVAQMNQKTPTIYPTNGRMEIEKKTYTVRGFISYYKQETGSKGDRDYHVVITDHPGQYTENKDAAPDGQSMVVEFPDVRCLSGASGVPAVPSSLTPAIADARATFEQHMKWPKDTRLTQPIPVTVTGIGFFDFEHKQKGRATPYPDPPSGKKVFELHPVTEITFENDVDNG